MRTKVWTLLFSVVAVTVVALVLPIVGTAGPSFRVTSTLDGESVLPSSSTPQA
jgi:hypothetical protein